MPPLAANQVRLTRRSMWRAWLRKNHNRTSGIWLVYPKRQVGASALTYSAMVEEALCFGWVDSLPRKFDAMYSQLWFAPRKPTANWSALNKQRVEALMRAGRMHPHGVAVVAAAKKRGTWNALDAVEKLTIPPDLARALAKKPKAKTYFTAFPPSVKRGILEWILNAKQDHTRSKRIRTTVQLAAKNIRANQWRQ